MCRVLEAKASGYYAWRARRSPSSRAVENKRLVDRIQAIHDQRRGNYGSPKVYRKLRRDGERVNHKRVARLMKENALTAKRARKFKVTTTSRHALPVCDNVLARNFQTVCPDQVWTSEITYLWTDEGWLYLAVFLDLYLRLVLGWAVSERLTTEFVEQAFLHGQRRLGRRRLSAGAFRSRKSVGERGAFKQRLAAWGCSPSMSRKGDCWDNAVRESFFGILKSELVYHDRKRHAARGER